VDTSKDVKTKNSESSQDQVRGLRKRALVQTKLSFTNKGNEEDDRRAHVDQYSTTAAVNKRPHEFWPSETDQANSFLSRSARSFG
jgi:hypothetical protein